MKFIRVLGVLCMWILSVQMQNLHNDDENEYLTDLYNLMSSYEIQKNRHKFNVKNLKNWNAEFEDDKENFETEIKVTDENFNEFSSDITANYNITLKTKKSPKIIEKINEILSFTLSHAPKIHCTPDNKMTIKANFIQTSQLSSTTKYCGNTIKSLEILVSDTIFFDSISDLRGFKFVSILAPNWSIVNKSLINLSGVDADNYTFPAANGRFANQEGDNGKPGLPGNPGGSFFGLGIKFAHASLLTVKSYGGRGGNGQNGGNGGYFNKGGNGGEGGDGGFPGKIKLIQINNEKSDVVFQVNIGWHGKGGKGGIGGSDSSVAGLDNYNRKNCTSAEKPFNFHRGYLKKLIDDYKIYLLDNNFENFITRRRVIEFYNSLVENSEVEDLYDISAIFQEFKNLEERFYQADNDARSDFLTIYKILLKVAEKFVKNKSQDEGFKKVLNYLLTCLLSKISSIEESSINFIINLREFSDLIISKIRDLEKIGDKTIIERNRDNLRKEFENKIAETQHLINLHIVPKLKFIISKFDEQIDELNFEIKKLESQSRKNVKLLEEKKKKLEALSVLKSIFKILSIFTQFIPNVPRVLDIGATAASAGLEYLMEKEMKSAPDVKRVEGAKYIGKLEKIEHEISYSSGSISSCNSEAFSRKRRGVKNLFKTGSEMYQKNKYKINEDFKELKSDFKKDRGDVAKISDRIEESNKQIKNLQQLESHLCSSIKPIMGNLLSEIKNLKDYFTNKTETQLVIKNFELESKLKQIKFHIQHLFKGFILEENIGQTLDQLVDILNTLTNIFKVIEKYNEQKKLGEYISKINSEKFLNMHVSDPEHEKILNHLTLQIKSNIILMEYKLFVKAIKQYTFPLADVYLKKFDIREELLLKNSTQDFVQTAVKQIEDFRHKLWKHKISIDKFDYLKLTAGFYGDSGRSLNGPFHVWKNEENRHLVNRLLEGKEVVLTSRQTSNKISGLKFNSVEIRLKIDSLKEFDDELNSLLIDNKISVSLTHTGNSYYKCGDKTFIISTDSQNMLFSYQKDFDSDEPISKNEVYSKIKNGDFILSPFTTWKVQLVNHTGFFDFQDLKKFADFVEIELVGEGEFYNFYDGLCDHDLEKYYDLEDVDVRNENDSLYEFSIFEENGWMQSELGRNKEYSVGMLVSRGTTVGTDISVILFLIISSFIVF